MVEPAAGSMTEAVAPKRDRIWRSRDAALAVTALVGAATIAVMIFETGAREILRDLARVGWALPVIVGVHLPLIACAALAWRAALGHCWSGPLHLLIWARWIREATNTLLPVAQVGGEIVGIRLLALAGAPLNVATASVILDKTNEALAQVLFVLLGLTFLASLADWAESARWIVLSLPFAVLIAICLLLAQRCGVYLRLERLLMAVGKGFNASGLSAIAGLNRVLVTLFQPKGVVSGVLIHLIAWIAGAGELWLALYFMGHPIDPACALIMESLGQLMRGIGFIVPGALGVQEGGFLAIGAVLGLPSEAALALSLVRRISQIALGVPALLSWQIAEARRGMTAAPRSTSALGGR